MNIVITSDPAHRPEGEARHYADVYDDEGKHVLESIYDEFNEVIELVTRYAKPGEAGKGYGTAAFVAGPLALSLNTGKPMVVDEFSHDAMMFYNALEAKRIARFRQTPNAEYRYAVEALEEAGNAVYNSPPATHIRNR